MQLPPQHAAPILLPRVPGREAEEPCTLGLCLAPLPLPTSLSPEPVPGGLQAPTSPQTQCALSLPGWKLQGILRESVMTQTGIKYMQVHETEE